MVWEGGTGLGPGLHLTMALLVRFQGYYYNTSAPGVALGSLSL